MRDVTISKDRLLDRLRENRAAHRGVFEEAVEGWRKAVEEEVQRVTELLLGGKPQNVYVSLPAPVDQTRNYNRVIAMLEEHEGEKVQLPEQDFAQYWLDDWSWKRQWMASNSDYSASATAYLAEQA